MIQAVGGHRVKRDTITNKRLEAFIGAAGGRMMCRDDWSLPDDCECYVQWGYKLTNLMEDAIKKRIPYIILDGSYFRDYQPHALDAVTVSINGFHGKGLQVDVSGLPSRPHPPLKPWRETPEDPVIYVYNQLQKDRATFQYDMDAWASKAAREAAGAFGHRAIIRPHPKMISSWEPALPPLQGTFEEAFMAITWTSTVGVTALIEGVPTVTMHPGSPAHRGATGLDRDDKQRERWIHELSWKQFQPDDLDQAWRYVAYCWDEAAAQAEADAYDREGLRR